MAMCPGVTETTIFSDIHRRPLREEWGNLAEGLINAFPKQK